MPDTVTINLPRSPSNSAASAFSFCVAATTVSGRPGLTTASNRSLRSLGRAKARPLTKRYVQLDMKKQSVLIWLLFSFSTLSIAETESDVYQVTLKSPQSDLRLFVCINEECQKSLSYKKAQDGYIYDFGTFPVPNIKNIELKAFRYYPEKRRIRRAREQYVLGVCDTSSCGSFNFTKAHAPVTSTTDLCKLGLSSCGRGPSPR
jgi:hypothetical protein